MVKSKTVKQQTSCNLAWEPFRVHPAAMPYLSGQLVRASGRVCWLGTGAGATPGCSPRLFPEHRFGGLMLLAKH